MINFDGHVNLGNIMVTTGLGVVSWGLRRIYTQIAQFVHRVDANEEQLDIVSGVVDRHSEALLGASLLKSPFPRVQHRRRREDVEEMFT